MKYLTLLVISFSLNTYCFGQVDSSNIPPPPPPVHFELDDEEFEDKVYLAAEEMPIFPGCENEKDAVTGLTCTEMAILNHVQKNSIYPELARENGCQGKVFIEFIVNKEGNIEDIKVVKGAYPSLDEAAMNAVKTLPKMKPALQRGEPVKIRFTVPINFKLSGIDIPKKEEENEEDTTTDEKERIRKKQKGKS